MNIICHKNIKEKTLRLIADIVFHFSKINLKHMNIFLYTQHLNEVVLKKFGVNKI